MPGALAPSATGSVLPLAEVSRTRTGRTRSLKHEFISTSSKAEPPQSTSLACSADGQTLLAGYTDNLVRVWQAILGTR